MNKKDLLKDLSKETGLSVSTVKYLVSKGLDSKEKIRHFTDFKLKDLVPIETYKDGVDAIKRIIKSVNKREHVLVYADYDCDGVMAGTIMVKVLKTLGVKVDYFVNDREKYGFGLCIEGYEEAKAKFGKFDLVITVDNGIDRKEAVDHIKKDGCDIVITDHHEPLPDGTLPECIVVDAKRLDEDPATYKYCCGAGIAYKMMFNVYQQLKGLDVYETFADPVMRECLSFAATATIADMVEMVDDNHYIAKMGLKEVANSDNPGWVALRKAAGKQKIDETAIGFIFAPAINAMSRMGEDPCQVIELFTSDTIDHDARARHILDVNEARKKQCDKYTAIAIADVTMNERNEENDLIKVTFGNYPEGIAGIIASRVQEQLEEKLPVIVLCASNEKPGLYKGSARSVAGVNIKKALDDCADILESYGGHEMAAGLSIKKEYLHTFIERMNKAIAKIKEDVEDVKTKADFVMSACNLDVRFINEIETVLEPFGPKFERPNICIAGIATDIKPLGKTQEHTKLVIDNCLDVLLWRTNWIDIRNEYGKKGMKIFGTPKINTFGGKISPQFEAKGLTEWDYQKQGIKPVKDQDGIIHYCKA